MDQDMRLDLWTNQEIARALGFPDEPFLWSATGVSMDTRTLKPGDLYIAIKGESQDGHAFVAEAFEKGAVAAVVDHLVMKEDPFPQVVVGDTLKALAQLGTFARQRTKATLMAVTGSVGKTSVKELLRHVLGAFGTTFASPASYNNHWGVPFSLASMPRDAAYGVFEVGMNHRGEIAPLASLVRPHIGVVTAIADAHIGHMGSRQAIAEEKSDIFSAAPACSLAIVNQDMLEFDLVQARAAAFGVSQVVGFGKSQKAAVQLVSYHPDLVGLRSSVTARVGGQNVTYTLSQPGEHVAMNSLIALVLGEALGLSQERVIAQLETWSAVPGRGKHHVIPVAGGEILLIDDAYNANLTSMEAGLSVLAALPSKGRRLAVLGEMLELGDQAVPQHHQLMEAVLSRPIDLVFASGGSVMETAFTRHIPREKAGGYAAHVEALAPLVMDALRPGDIVFVKGSKGSRVSKIVEALIARKNLTDGVAR
ncbi:MAG: UDP-N-acetylmuramoylalanyl-D-glutamyl-2,6-diaminopimelate-D-alanyl-D-alanyl ligase [Alphaproteobacteria bacterium]|jgi:UDP-N-acetylmuramoyl-tripeptide--D-alanyl-D-alanine ligase|nr:UDP-N-acetylmuramoylalanyl-D-glutamyl-2,6-diaminopimelate-D-alanyl-D-alanyl ligase [Alphaproteobacteria bacterium]